MDEGCEHGSLQSEDVLQESESGRYSKHEAQMEHKGCTSEMDHRE